MQANKNSKEKLTLFDKVFRVDDRAQNGRRRGKRMSYPTTTCWYIWQYICHYVSAVHLSVHLEVDLPVHLAVHLQVHLGSRSNKCTDRCSARCTIRAPIQLTHLLSSVFYNLIRRGITQYTLNICLASREQSLHYSSTCTA